MQVLAPRLQSIQLYTIEIHEALVNRVAEIGWSLLADDAHHAARQFSIEFVVRGEHGNLLSRELLRQLKVWCTLLDSHLLSLIGTSHYATVVVRQNHDRFSLQVRTENLLAWAVTIVQISYTVHLFYIFSKVLIRWITVPQIWKFSGSLTLKTG